MITLHAYILRELLKTFGLTVLALTALFTMGGGLYNVLKVEGVTAGDLFTVLPMLIPVAIAITMPVAALFAATMTYGRLAADNEFVACRAAGINVHRVFLSAILLSVFVALSTGLSVNVLIPSFMHRVAHFARSNVRNLAFQRLLRRGYIEYGKAGTDRYLLTAQQVQPVREEELVRKGFDPPGHGISYFWVDQPTFLIVDKDGKLERFSVAEGGLFQFNTLEEQIEFTLYVRNARDYEVGKRVVQIQQQKIGPYARDIPFSPRPSMVSLNTLREWQVTPWKSSKLNRKINNFLGLLRCYVLYAETARRLETDHTVVLYDNADSRYEVSAQSFTPRRKDLLLNQVTIVRHNPRPGALQTTAQPVRFEAPQAKLHAEPLPDGQTLIELELVGTADQPVLEYNPRWGNYQTPREKESLRLDGLVLPQYVLDRMQACVPAAVIDPSADLPTSPELEDRRVALQREAERLQRKVKGVLHSRFSFTGSALVTILMAAALGMVFRGSRALAAFGLASIPFATVAVLVTMGKQLTESEATEAVGPFLVWGSLILVGVADVLILGFGVRR